MSQSVRTSRIRFDLAVDLLLWRILALARGLEGRVPLLGRLLRRAVLLVWWTATGQVHVHARYWIRARRLRRVAPPLVAAEVLEAVDARTLVVPLSATPVVSVIVPTYGQVDYTLRCLASVIRHAPSVPIEVIVIDDAWTGADASELACVSGIRLVHNETNLGFLHSCNKAAGMAKGQYLLFLNNDTQVLSGWLEPMLALFQQWPRVGAVGAKLLYPDGRLQEAGGIIWRDGSGWNFGRHEDPDKPVYNYVREVDYCSGAALMVDRAVFAGLGGFDTRYAPAYFEDTDLCFRLRQIGLRTLYQPASQIIHFEGVSHGRDTSVGTKSYQVVNRKTFVNTWLEVLARDHFPNGEQVFRARERSGGRRIVLVIDHYVPTADRDAGSRAIMDCLHVLLQAGMVVKFWPHNQAYSPGYTEILQGMGIEVLYGPSQARFDEWIASAGEDIDTVIVSRPEVAEDVIAAIRRHSRARVVYYGHDLHFRRLGQQAEIEQDHQIARQAEHMRAREYAIWRQADVSLYLSEEEAQIASALQPDCRIDSVVPYCFDRFGEQRAAPAGMEIVFVAGFGHPPNEDAAVWFVNEILPLVRSSVPGAHLSIIGSNPTDLVQGLAGDGVAVYANVTDAALEEAYGRARVAVVPLRCGAGVKLKVVEALRAGLPLVTTPVGAQGLAGLSRIAAVRDDPGQFAASVVGLLLDDAAWELRSLEQVNYARERFSRQVMSASILKALNLVRLPESRVHGWIGA